MLEINTHLQSTTVSPLRLKSAHIIRTLKLSESLLIALLNASMQLGPIEFGPKMVQIALLLAIINLKPVKMPIWPKLIDT